MEKKDKERQSGLSPEAEAALRLACQNSTQAAVARRLGLSTAAVNQALQGKYKGLWETIEQRVRGVLLQEAIECPVLGEIKRNVCLEHQNRPKRFAMVNAQYIKMYRACRSGCPFSNLPSERKSHE